MHRPALMRLVLSVGMLTILMLALTACGGGSSAEQRKRRKPIRSTLYRRTRKSYEGKPLPAGRYVTEEFKPAMSFTLEKGWTRGGTELRDVWDLRT